MGRRQLQLRRARQPPQQHRRRPHQQLPVRRAQQVAKDVESRGLTVEKELKVATPGGNKETRFVDVAGNNAEGKVAEMHQVGRQNRNGARVSREIKTMNDIEGATGQRPTYHPYDSWGQIVGHQVNFFVTQTDIAELEDALREIGPLLILHSRSSTPQPRILKSLDYDEGGKPWLYFYLIRPQDLTKIVTTNVATQGYWTIDTTTAPVIEFHRSFFNGEIFRRGRVYFVDSYYGRDRGVVSKSEEFGKWAQKILSVIKKHLIKDGGNYCGADAKQVLASSRNIVIEE